MAGLSGDIPEPGDMLLFDAAGLAILIVRARSGELRAFLNMCMHRGARLVSDCRRRNLVTCPFHGWSFDLDGRLVGLPGAVSFEGVERADRGLIPVPVAEWAGLIFVKAHAGDEAIDAEAWLGELATVVAGLALADAVPIKHSRIDVEANWKFTLDTYGEGYHFAALHPTTFAQDTAST